MNGAFYQTLCDLGIRYQDKPAILYLDGNERKEVYYPEFLETVERRRRAYACLPQKRIGIWAGNSYEWIVSAAGILLAGKTLILLDVNLDMDELKALAEYTDTELMVTDSPVEGIPSVPLGSVQETGAAPETTEEGELICFTSGTSSSAKGVVIPASTLAGAIAAGLGVFAGEAGERFYMPLPFYHIYGFTQFYYILRRGGILCIGRSRYMRREMEAFRPQVTVLVPVMIQYLLKQNLIKDPVYAVLTGGGMLSAETAAQLQELGIHVGNGYGLSETLGQVSMRVANKDYRWQKPLEGMRFVLSPEGEIGIYLPFHMKEYYKKPEDTAAVLDPETHLLWTGDAGEIDSDGCMRWRGRLRDTIVLENGEKVHAEDLDAEMAGFHGIQEGAVIGVAGHIGAVFVLEPDSSEEEIREQVRQLNGKRNPFMRIVDLWFREEPLPRTAIGKLKRFELEKEYRT